MADVESPVFLFDGDDPAMGEASKRAQDTFRFFWREMAWESRRIVPGLSLAAVKAPFWDASDGTPAVEHMWVNDVTFDGETVTGTLLNSPNWVRSVSAGARVEIPLSHLGDWMYATPGQPVCGAYTVNLLRSRMSPAERAQHDEMWGLDFGDPDTITLVPDWGTDNPEMEHPMSDNMAEPWGKQLAASPISDFMQPDAQGWTLLHHLALAGSLATVKLLLEHGADASLKTHDGRTPLDLAKSMRWTSVIALFDN